MINIFGLLQIVNNVKCGEECKEAATKISSENFYTCKIWNY